MIAWLCADILSMSVVRVPWVPDGEAASRPPVRDVFTIGVGGHLLDSTYPGRGFIAYLVDRTTYGLVGTRKLSERRKCARRQIHSLPLNYTRMTDHKIAGASWIAGVLGGLHGA